MASLLEHNLLQAGEGSSPHLAQILLLGRTSKLFALVPHLQDRAVVSSKEWRHQIQQVDTDIYQTLRHGISGGFDEEKFGHRIGFGNLKKYISFFRNLFFENFCCLLLCTELILPKFSHVKAGQMQKMFVLTVLQILADNQLKA